MKTKFLEITGKAKEVILRYPMVLFMALLTSVGAIYLYETTRSRNDSFTCYMFTICSGLGISLMFALKILSQRIGKRYLLELAGVIGLIGLFFILPGNKKDFTEVYGYIIAVAFILSHLLVSFVAFLNKDRELNFWQYNKNLFVNIVLTAIFTGVLTAGVELAILAIDKLFDFQFNDRVYFDVFFFLAIAGSCLIFLIFNERGLPDLEKDSKYPVVLKFFTQFILIPLLCIYAVILYFYSLKILINGELPRGWVSYLILAYSIVGILALLLVHPLKEDHIRSWVKVFSRLFYYTVIPLVILLFVAIFTRLLEYGYTEPRYFVLLLAVWLTSLIVYFIVIKKPSIKFIPVSLFIFGAFSLVFPYLNAFSVAKRSQKSELMKLLNENNLLTNNTIDFNKKISDAVIDKMASQFEFLIQRKQEGFLLNLVDPTMRGKLLKDFEEPYYWAINNSLRNSFTYADKHATALAYEQLTLESETEVVNIETYRYLIKFQSYGQESKEISGDLFLIDNKTEKIKVILNSKEEVDFTPAIDKLFKDNIRTGETIKLKEVAVESDLGKYHVKIIFPTVTKQKSARNIYYNDAVLLIKEK
ncbi:DUF4153 domain-containing protein [Chryseobacterium sp. Bi04]|uniref:DUF4153 domain-containing protein n=1 Tax=Chryseobacterium sp. Bi04 TaxID=2822345 RepID=UPI001D74B172|nr:DUF4153 domain-containing protein [Chryseobacterium sp. Bi04]CAH0183194.1 hypothetical protein SRABI04_01554 [Chryseobacterium sp. Bi04]